MRDHGVKRLNQLVYGRRQPRGSLLVFAVIVIAVLAMMATTMMLVLGQSTRLSTNVVGRIEGDFAAKSGIEHATRVLHDSVTRHMIYTDKGVYFYSGSLQNPWFHENLLGSGDNFDPDLSSPPFVTPWKQFVQDTTAPVTAPDFGFALSDYNALEPFRYTSSPLYTSPAAMATGQPERALVYELQGSTSEFYKDTDNFHAGALKAKVMPRISSVRGKYWIWVTDLDSKLYIHARGGAERIGWGIDTFRTGDFFTVPPPTEDEVIAGVFDNIELGGGIISPDLIEDLKALNLPPVTSNDQRQRHFSSMDEAATHLQILHPLPSDSMSEEEKAAELAKPTRLDPVTYAELRAQLGVYFTTYRDTPKLTSTNALKQVKDNPNALNINTASVELIAAALSQIPARDFLSDPFTDKTLSTLEDRPNWHINLAKRIVGARPFLCRMDFEDFLAAHLMGSPVAEDDPGELNNPPDNNISNDPSYVRMIYYAMQRRWGQGYTPNLDAAITPTAPINIADEDRNRFKDPELSLARYLEMPGIPDQAPQFKAVIGGKDTWPNEPLHQIARFKFFFESSLGAPRSECLVTPFEFNNIINSISTAKDDIQVVPFGQTVTPARPIILPGSDGILQTIPQGDDGFVSRIYPGPNGVLDTVVLASDLVSAGVIEPGPDGVLNSIVVGDDEEKQDTTTIWPGPNGIVETQVGPAQPSYYSYIDDIFFAENFWDDPTTGVGARLQDYVDATPALPQTFYDSTHLLSTDLRSLLYEPGISMLQADIRASNSMRFYYRLPLNKGNPAPVPPSHPNGLAPTVGLADVGHLVSWRCLPVGDSVKLTGFYQMAFDDWSTYYGPMQAMGDYLYYSEGIQDTDADDYLYSSARPWSGTIVPYLEFDVDPRSPAPVTGVGAGDVSWGPKFAFRSRFFAIHVLGQGDMQGWKGPEPLASDNALRDKLKAQGEKRIEAVYDALLDQIIWQRSPVTDKRAMGEPLPP